MFTLSRYEVEEAPIGRGGMGEVYAARDLLYNEPCVIKVIRPDLLHRDPVVGAKLYRQFFREAMASARLSRQCEYIVSVTNVGLEQDIAFMAAEFMEGGSVQKKVGDATLVETRRILGDVCKALEVAHGNGIVHSDLSPDNILSDKEGKRFKVSDFGLLKVLESILVSRGTSLFTGGKVRFMPIAHMLDTKKICEKTDLYAMGVVMYLLLSGEFVQIDDPAVIPRVSEVKIKKENKLAPTWVAELVNRCLALDVTLSQVVQALSQK